MGDHLALMAAHLRLLSQNGAQDPRAGVTLLQARAHLDERTWKRWLAEDVGMEADQANHLMARAEASGASLDALRPREL